MGMPAARMGDMVLQDAPHCHAPMHPGPPPVPIPHPAVPLAIIKGAPNVMIGGQPAARATDNTAPCILPTCVPAPPPLGMIAKASLTVMIGGLPAARINDLTAHPTCTIPPFVSPTGKILPPGCPTVLIGG